MNKRMIGYIENKSREDYAKMIEKGKTICVFLIIAAMIAISGFQPLI